MPLDGAAARRRYVVGMQPTPPLAVSGVRDWSIVASAGCLAAEKAVSLTNVRLLSASDSHLSADQPSKSCS